MYTLYIVRRTQIYLDEAQDERLSKRAATEKVTKSALIREAVDQYLNGSDNQPNELARFRAAIIEAGKHPIRRLPPGKEYVEALRRTDARRQRELERRWRG
jgi:hypothetical protein